MRGTPIMAYKGLTYEIISGGDGNVAYRQMRFRDSGESVDLTEYGEITLEDFKNIVNTYLNTEPK